MLKEENMVENADKTDLIGLTADIVSAFVSANSLRSSELPEIIASVHAALSGLGKPAVPEAQALVPAVPIRKSITPDYLISLEDGSKYKSLKRHLRTKYNMSPDEYRTKWGLPSDYPMTAPNYTATRSNLAKAIGLGAMRRKSREPEPPATTPVKRPAKRAKKAAPKAAE